MRLFIAGRKLQAESSELKKAADILKNYIKDQRLCSKNAQMTNMTYETLVANKMVRMGFRDQSPQNLRLLRSMAAMEIEYIQLTATLLPCKTTVRARFQNEKKFPERFKMNAEPLIQELYPNNKSLQF